MAGESAHDKAMRLLTEGRLIVRQIEVNPGRAQGYIRATCRGDSGEVYNLGYDPIATEWRCTCAARTPQCSHLQALWLVVVKVTVTSE